MTLLNAGLNKVKDLIANDLSTMILGTDGTTPTESDTGLIAPQSATEKSITVSTSDKTIGIKYILRSTEGNGVTYREAGTKFSGGTHFDRFTFTPVAKDNTFELHIRKRFFIKNG